MFEIAADIYEGSFSKEPEFGLAYLQLFEEFPETGSDMLKTQCKYMHAIRDPDFGGITHENVPNCDFHVHKSGEECSSKKKASSLSKKRKKRKGDLMLW
jgi:hypothetical protein